MPLVVVMKLTNSTEVAKRKQIIKTDKSTSNVSPFLSSSLTFVQYFFTDNSISLEI